MYDARAELAMSMCVHVCFMIMQQTCVQFQRVVEQIRASKETIHSSAVMLAVVVLHLHAKSSFNCIVHNLQEQ